MAVFNSAVFNPAVFFTDSGVVAEPPRPPRPADDERRRRIVKPTGLVDRPRKPTVEERIDDSREIQREISARLYDEFAATPAPQATLPPVHLMSQRDIDRELGERLRQIAARQQEEDDDMLMIAAMLF